MIAMDSRDLLIVALDMPEVAAAEAMVGRLGDTVGFYKIGLELVFAGGLAFASDLKQRGKRVFLDMKLLDISNTVEKATANIARLGFDFLTIHGHDGKTMRAAVQGRSGSDLKLLAVTVLTHLDRSDLDEQGTVLAPAELVLRRAVLAREAGCDGVVASGLEAGAIRRAAGDGFLIVTPGIRLADDAVGDQARVATPARAIREGADHLVVGRPITAAADPKAAAERFQAEIRAALASRPASA